MYIRPAPQHPRIHFAYLQETKSSALIQIYSYTSKDSSFARSSIMKAFTISAAIAMLVAQAHTSPIAVKSEARQFKAHITFQGAPRKLSFPSIYIPIGRTSRILHVSAVLALETYLVLLVLVYKKNR